MSDLEEDDGGGAGITQMRNKPADSVRCKSDKPTKQQTACCWISTAVSLWEVNEEWLVPKRLESKAAAVDHFLTCSNRKALKQEKTEI